MDSGAVYGYRRGSWGGRQSAGDGWVSLPEGKARQDAGSQPWRSRPRHYLEPVHDEDRVYQRCDFCRALFKEDAADEHMRQCREPSRWR